MAVLSEQLQIILNRLMESKTEINKKYDVTKIPNIEELKFNTLPESIERINCLGTYDATATSEDIKEGLTAYVSGEKITGTMPLIPSERHLIDITQIEYMIPKGYHDGNGSVYLETEDLEINPSNEIQTFNPSDGKIFNAVTANPVTGNATVQDVLKGKVFSSSNGIDLVGDMPAKTPIDETLYINKTEIVIPKGFYDTDGRVRIFPQEKTCMPGRQDQSVTPDNLKVLSKVLVNGDPNLLPENIMPGKTIFGVSSNIRAIGDTKIPVHQNLNTNSISGGVYTGNITAEITDYHIVYVVNSEIVHIQDVQCGRTFTIMQTPTVPGYTVKGWSKTPNATTATYTSGQTVSTDLIAAGNVIALYLAKEEINISDFALTQVSAHNGVLTNGQETSTIKATKDYTSILGNYIITYTCGTNGVTLTASANKKEATLVTTKPGFYVVIGTLTSDIGITATAAVTVPIKISGGNNMGIGSFAGETFDSGWSDLIDGCYIKKYTFSLKIPDGHGNTNDYLRIYTKNTNGEEKQIQNFFGNLSSNLHTYNATFTLPDDVRQIKFTAATPGHAGCVPGAAISWNIEYEFDMSLYSGEVAGGNTGGNTGTSSGTAKPADVLYGKTFDSSSGKNQTGTMPNNGAIVYKVNASSASATIPKGYHNGSGNVSIEWDSVRTVTPKAIDQTITANPNKTLQKVIIKGDSNLIASNIKKGVTIFGITGTCETDSSNNNGGTGGIGGVDDTDTNINEIPNFGYGCNESFTDREKSLFTMKYGYFYDNIIQEGYYRIYNSFKYNGTKDKYQIENQVTHKKEIIPSIYIYKGKKYLYIKMSDIIEKYHYTFDNIMHLVDVVKNDCPEVFWKWETGFLQWENGDIALPCFEESTRQSYIQDAQNALNEIKALCKQYYNIDYNESLEFGFYTDLQCKQIGKVIHDWLVVNNKYGNANSTEGLNQIAWPALSKGKYDPVCASYATAFHYLCNQFGMCACSIYGGCGNNPRDARHQWNIVRYKNLPYTNNFDKNDTYNADWQEVDITWDDPTPDGGKGYCNWDYFNVTTAYMSQSRVRFQQGGSEPTMAYNRYPIVNCKCNSNRYNYTDTLSGGKLYSGF